MKTVMQELKEKLQQIKENNCGSFMEMLFFDGVLAIIDAEFIEKEKQIIIEAANHGANFDKSPYLDAEDYYIKTFKND